MIGRESRWDILHSHGIDMSMEAWVIRENRLTGKFLDDFGEALGFYEMYKSLKHVVELNSDEWHGFLDEHFDGLKWGLLTAGFERLTKMEL